ncbi:MAG: hypothetical protein BWY83_03431 [bacterium ADurb.Bin478]|nr:MAG: hypothetical protein BWY83_03431 [bacterium ADurb.Bin478]
MRYCSQILGQTGAAEGKTRFEIIGTEIEFVILDKHIHHDAAVDVHGFAKPTDFIGKADLDGVERIVRILDHGRLARPQLKDRRGQFAVQVRQHVGGTFVEGADDRFRRVVKVMYRSALAQELGVQGKAEIFSHFFARTSFQYRQRHLLGNAG